MLTYFPETFKTSSVANFGRPYRQCSMTVMDTVADPFITFDEDGISNYYHECRQRVENDILTGDKGRDTLNALVAKIKASGRGNKYDCITGVSGGVDSTYLMLQAKKLGLRPLVVHFDNGWNSELAVNNIQNIISRLGFDLYTLVVDWQEFRDLQTSYLKANVVDIEALTDHAIIGALYKLASKNNIKYILSGVNVATEGILPEYWIFNKADSVNIKDIHKRYGKVALKTYPFFSTKIKRYYLDVKRITAVSPLNFMEYNKEAVKSTIKSELGWRDYGGKHGESIFTRFYQGHILPIKFGIDKRKAHYSSMICSNQMSRQEALALLEEPIYAHEQLIEDREFVLKKLGLSDAVFDNYLVAPRVEHSEYKHEKGVWNDIPFIRPFRPVWKIVKKIRNHYLLT